MPSAHDLHKFKIVYVASPTLILLFPERRNKTWLKIVISTMLSVYVTSLGGLIKWIRVYFSSFFTLGLKKVCLLFYWWTFEVWCWE